jgi:hypothetical protein
MRLKRIASRAPVRLGFISFLSERLALNQKPLAAASAIAFPENAVSAKKR